MKRANWKYTDPDHDKGLTDQILWFLQEHKALDTGYLYALVAQWWMKKYGKKLSYQAFQTKLTKLCEVPDPHGRIFIYQPSVPLHWDRSKDKFPKRVQGIFKITDDGYDRLEKQGRLYQHTPRDGSDIIHQYMTGTFTAQVWLACENRGLHYVSFEEVATDHRCKDAAWDFETSYGNLEMDGFFGIRYPDERERFFAVESERYGKTMKASQLTNSAFGNKVPKYQEVIRKRMFKRLGINNLIPITNAVNASRMTQILEIANDKNFLFGVMPRFGKEWETCRVEYTQTKGGHLKPIGPIIDDPLAEPFHYLLGRFDISVASI